MKKLFLLSLIISIISINIASAGGTSFQVKNGEYYGMQMLSGYVEIKKEKCVGMCSPDETNFVYFILANPYPSLEEFTNIYGNPDMKQNIRLGCYDEVKNEIFAQVLGKNKAYTKKIKGSNLKKLLKSNKENTIGIKVKRELYEGDGFGGSTCSAPVSVVKIFK